MLNSGNRMINSTIIEKLLAVRIFSGHDYTGGKKSRKSNPNGVGINQFLVDVKQVKSKQS